MIYNRTYFLQTSVKLHFQNMGTGGPRLVQTKHQFFGRMSVFISLSSSLRETRFARCYRRTQGTAYITML